MHAGAAKPGGLRATHRRPIVCLASLEHLMQAVANVMNVVS
jgi:hypothetical protein